MPQQVLPAVTIAIPTYNRADSYLRQAVESALGQTYPNVEIIVSDNCSTDRTQALMQELVDPRLTYVRQAENIGANNNFNYCLQEARGDYFVLLQDDDLIDPDFIEVCVQAAGSEAGVGLVRTGTRVIDAQGSVLKKSLNQVGGLATAEFFCGWFRGETSLYLCSTMFHTQKLRDIGGYQSKHNLFQDVFAEVQLAARFGRVDVQEVKASFRKHPAQSTFSAKVLNWCEDSRLLLDLMCTLVPADKEPLVRRDGTRYFTKVNYDFARQIRSPVERFMTYWAIYRSFDYRYPPFYYSVYKRGLRRIRQVARKAKRLLAKVSADAAGQV